MKRFFLLNVALCASLIAAPEGFHLVQGDAKPPIRNGAGDLVIESGKQAVIQWDSFSIAQQEAVRFIQQDAQSKVLNRVIGSSKSCIDGLLFSNGQIYLINPNGVLIGPNGKIMTAGFIASTLDLLDEDFLRGSDLSFRGNSNQPIVNLGTIEATGWDLFLLAGKIQNQGSLTANQGTVGMGVGNEILLKPQGHNRIFIKCGLERLADSEALLDQSGLIEAMNVELQCGTRPYAKAIRVSGTVHAFSVQEEGGRVYLLADGGEGDIQGTIAARSGSKGGHVCLLGKEVNVCGEATIDVSGERGGGTALIGGDFGGKNPEVPNSDTVFLGSSAQVLAMATQDGEGGQVSFWGNQRLDVYGKVNVEAGPIAGNGGKVEISTAGILIMNGEVKQGAPHGKPGHTLYDPVDITIRFSADDNINNPGGAGTYTFPPGCASTTSNIDSNSLSNNLIAGDVTINTSASGGAACGGTGNITVEDSVNWTGSGRLTMIADGGITINDSAFIIGGAGAVSFQTNSGNLQIGNTVVNTNQINLDIAGDCNLTATTSGTWGFSTNNSINGFIGGNLNISSSATSARALIGRASSSGSPVSTDVTLTVGNNVSLFCSAFNGSAQIGVRASGIASGAISITAGGDVTLSGSTGIAQIGHVSSTASRGNITISSGGNISGMPADFNGRVIFGHGTTGPGLISGSSMLLIANNSINMNATVGTINVQLPFVDIEPLSTITLVCDNANPSVLDPNSTAGIHFIGNAKLESPTDGSTVSAVKLYSISSSLDTLPGGIINGESYPPPSGQENLYQENGVFYPGGTYGGQAYMNFYKLSPPSPPAPTPTPTPIIVDPVQVTTISSTTAIANIIAPPTNIDSSTVIQGPAAQTDQNPNDAINQTNSYNNDYHTTQTCP